jgi:hypothetical protein
LHGKYNLDKRVKTSIKEHLTNLELNSEYFLSFDGTEHRQKLWILNPFNDNAIEPAGIPEQIKKQLLSFLMTVH